MMTTKILRRLAGLALVLAAGSAAAQQATPQVPQPKMYALSPSGAKAGSTIDVKIASGTDLDGADRLIFSHPGITAKVVTEEHGRLYPQGRSLEGRFKVSVAADVPAGIYEVRAAGYFGVTNARRFAVGEREETAEKEPNNDPATAQEAAAGSVVHANCHAVNVLGRNPAGRLPGGGLGVRGPPVRQPRRDDQGPRRGGPSRADPAPPGRCLRRPGLLEPAGLESRPTSHRGGRAGFGGGAQRHAREGPAAQDPRPADRPLQSARRPRLVYVRGDKGREALDRGGQPAPRAPRRSPDRPSAGRRGDQGA